MPRLKRLKTPPSREVTAAAARVPCRACGDWPAQAGLEFCRACAARLRRADHKAVRGTYDDLREERKA